MDSLLTINSIILAVSEVTIFSVFVGVVVAAGGGLYIFTANKTSTGRQSLAPNKNLINEKRAELLEYELKPKPSKVLENERSKKFDEALGKIDLEAMSQETLKRIEGLQPSQTIFEGIHNDKLKKVKVSSEKSQKNLEKDLSKIDDIINTR